MDRMLTAYIEAALWSSLDYSRQDESGNNPPLDETYSADDVTGSLLADMRDDCEQFYAANETDIERAQELDGYNLENIGHDFWLSREGHGAGFFDRYFGPDAEIRGAFTRLQEAARVYGEYSDTLNEMLAEPKPRDQGQIVSDTEMDYRAARDGYNPN